MIPAFIKRKSYIFYDYFKGFLIGIGCLIPGMSGGSVAIILGVYERLLENFSDIFKSFRKSVFNTAPLFFGAVTSILSFSSILYEFKTKHETLSNLLFCTITIICTVIFIKTNLNNNKIKYLYMFAGALVSAILSILSNFYSIETVKSPPYIFIVGLMLSIALILPGISFSYMMLFLGIYESTLEAISNVNITYLAFLSFGLIFGTLLFSKLILKLINKNKNKIYSLILGFIILSLSEILVNTAKC